MRVFYYKPKLWKLSLFSRLSQQGCFLQLQYNLSRSGSCTTFVYLFEPQRLWHSHSEGITYNIFEPQRLWHSHSEGISYNIFWAAAALALSQGNICNYNLFEPQQLWHSHGEGITYNCNIAWATAVLVFTFVAWIFHLYFEPRRRIIPAIIIFLATVVPHHH